MSFTQGQQVKPVAFIAALYPHTPYTPTEQAFIIGKIFFFDFETIIEGISYAGISEPSTGSVLWPLAKLVAV